LQRLARQPRRIKIPQSGRPHRATVPPCPAVLPPRISGGTHMKRCILVVTRQTMLPRPRLTARRRRLE
jgi:hypothetical protein